MVAGSFAERVLQHRRHVKGNANQLCNTVGMLSLSEWYVGLFFILLGSRMLWATDETVERNVKRQALVGSMWGCWAGCWK